MTHIAKVLTTIADIYWWPALWISERKWVQDSSNGMASLLWLVPLWVAAPILFWTCVVSLISMLLL